MKAFLLKLIFFWFFLLPISSAKEIIELVAIENLYEQQVGRIIITELYKKLGIKMTITSLPGMRAGREVALKRKDGEIMRIWEYADSHPDLIRVPTPYYQLYTSAFVVKSQGITLTDKKDLQNYHIVRVRGVKHTSSITKECKNVSVLKNSQLMMRFLDSGRADIALTNYADGMRILKMLDIDDIIALQPPLAVHELYHYLHKDHAGLVKPLDNLIRKMKKNGELHELIKRAEQRVLQDQMEKLFFIL